MISTSSNNNSEFDAGRMRIDVCTFSLRKGPNCCDEAPKAGTEDFSDLFCSVWCGLVRKTVLSGTLLSAQSMWYESEYGQICGQTRFPGWEAGLFYAIIHNTPAQIPSFWGGKTYTAWARGKWHCPAQTRCTAGKHRPAHRRSPPRVRCRRRMRN